MNNRNRAGESMIVQFTDRGEAALDELAAVLTARCSNSPEGIARVLDEVMHTPMRDLTASLDAIAAAARRRVGA